MSLTAVVLAITMGSATPVNATDLPRAEPLNPTVSAPPPAVSGLPSPVAPPSLDVPPTVVPEPSLVLSTASSDGLEPALPDEAMAPTEPIVTDADETSSVSPAEADQNEIIVGGAYVSTPGDPLERLNAQSFDAVQSVDAAIVEPVAKAYNKGLPRPIRDGLRNFFSNLDEPIIAAAYLLQFKPHSAVRTAGRFVINSTLGVAGLVDMAKRKPFNLPYRPNGIANTLGFYGVGPGPYFYLPVIGPTTLRDLLGNTAEIMIQPLAIGGPFADPVVTSSTTVLEQIGERAAFDERINEIRKEADPYATYRDYYLKQRQAEIDVLRGRATVPVVPVYGPGLRTAGGKGEKKKTDATVEANPQNIEPVELNPVPVISVQQAAEVSLSD